MATSSPIAFLPDTPQKDEHFYKQEFFALFKALKNDQNVENTLLKVQTPEQLLTFCVRYVNLNGSFAGFVSSLAGAVHLQNDMFIDTSAPALLADRSSLIASNIFFAAEDEYAPDHDRTLRITHRQLAQEFLQATFEFFGRDIYNWQNNYPYNAYIQDYCKQNYLCGFPATHEGVLKGLGFHVASEIMASFEYHTINAHFTKQFPEYAQKLRSIKGASGAPCLLWIYSHSSLEEEHGNYGFIAIKQALEWYQGPLSQEKAFNYVVEGFTNFAKMQYEFFKTCLD